MGRKGRISSRRRKLSARKRVSRSGERLDLADALSSERRAEDGGRRGQPGGIKERVDSASTPRDAVNRGAAFRAESPRPPIARKKGMSWQSAIVDRLRRWRARGLHAGKGPEPAAAQPTAPGEPPLVPFHKEIGDKAILGITAFGLSDEQLTKVLDTVEADCQRRGAVPVFLTDNDSFELFRARGMVFEYLPPPELREKFAPDLPWDLYLQRRYALFQRKWRPSGIISFGKRLPVDGEGSGATGPPGAPPVPPPEPPAR